MNAMCPLCDNSRINAQHLQKIHRLPVPSAEELCDDFMKRGETLRKKSKNSRKKLSEVLSEFEGEVLIYYEYISEFLSINSTT